MFGSFDDFSKNRPKKGGNQVASQVQEWMAGCDATRHWANHPSWDIIKAISS